MLLAISGFSLVAIAARELSDSLETYHILFYRSLFSVIIISCIFSLKGWQHLSFSHLKSHFFRNLAHFFGQYGWLYGIAFLPLAEVFALEFTVPIWTAIAAYLLLKENINRFKLIAIFLGLVGVLIILKPGFALIHPASIAVLLGAASYAISHTLTRKLATVTSVLNILFFMSVLQLFFALIPTINNWQNLNVSTLPFIVMITVFGLIAHYGMTKALSLSDATIVIPMDFLRLPLITVLAYFLYQEGVDIFLILGALIMLAGNMINVLYNSNTNLKN